MRTLIYNGNIYTLDKVNNTYQWMLIDEGKIVLLGNGDHYLAKDLQVDLQYNLHGQTVVPGFYDCHAHIVQTGLNSLGVDLRAVQTIDTLLQKIKAATSQQSKHKVIRGYHYDVTNIDERRFPTRHELDSVAPDHPVWINSVEYHTSALNSLALHKINLPYSIDGIARDERNLPLGLFTSKASAFVRNRMLNHIDDTQRLEGLKNALHLALQKGITSIHTMEGGYTFHEKDVAFIYEQKDNQPIDLKIYFQTFDLEKIAKYQFNCLGGDIFIDGSFSARTAAISSPYIDYDTNGKLYFNQNELNHYVHSAHQNNYQIALHAIGDRAIEQALNAYENALLNLPKRDHRHRIEHFELATDEQMRRAQQLGLIISVQPTFEYYWGNQGGMYHRRLGSVLANKTNNFRKMVDYGLTLCGGSDSDVNEMDPLLAIYAAVNHPKKDFAISALEALKLFTINAAKAGFEETIKGSLTPKKYADFVVLSGDILSVDPERIKDIVVDATFKEGCLIYHRTEQWLGGAANE